jgi:RNA polymerase sigma-54 factor
MGLDLRLDYKMTQTVVMTPRLQQAIKLLQYNRQEMIDHIQEAVLENPTLEVVPDSDDSGVSDRELELQSDVRAVEDDIAEQQNGAQDDIDWERFIEHLNDSRPTASLGGTIHDDLPPIETNLTYGESLAEHLLWQLKMLWCPDDVRSAAEVLVQNLDHRGYAQVGEAEVLETAGVDAYAVEEAFELVQGLDPLGCGARDLSECLIIQARVRFPEDDTFPKILCEKHLHNFERRNYAAIARDLDLDVEDVVEYHKMIQELEPTPGRGFGGDDPRYITPDLYVVDHEGEWVVSLNEEGMPDLRISNYYQKILRGASKQDKEYLIDKLRGAEFLIKSINKRRKTIRRVMDSILKFQREFFDEGPSRLRPMVLQDVADDIGVHMSTVSRVTTNKYVHTPHGLFELKFFFSAGVKSTVGADLASEAIKSRIKALMTDEDGQRPLSDQALANALKKEGVRIARRTVAKYREAMGILPSSQRKRMF